MKEISTLCLYERAGKALPSLQMQEPSMCEQEISFWQEHDEEQLIPYRPARQLIEQSSPWSHKRRQEGTEK